MGKSCGAMERAPGRGFLEAGFDGRGRVLGSMRGER